MPSRGEESAKAHAMRAGTEVLVREFFAPTCDRLFGLLEHPLFSVRVYSVILLTDLVTMNLPAFTVRPLADVAYRLKSLSDRDPHERVRACAAAHLGELMEAAAAYGALCRQTNARTRTHPRSRKS